MNLPFDGAKRRRVYLMRHGDVAYFGADGARVSDSRLVVLTPQGRAECLAMSEMLSEISFDAAMCSGLPRTIETAAIVLGGRTLPLQANPNLEEIRGGKPEQRAHLTPSQYAYAMFESGQPGAAYAGGEGFAHFYERVTAAWVGILGAKDWSTLLIAAHGGVNRAILSCVTGAGVSGFGAFEQDTGCLNIIDIDTAEDGTILRQIVRVANATPEDPAKAQRKLTAMEKLALQAFPGLKPPV